jgi:hypothetical protein
MRPDIIRVSMWTRGMCWYPLRRISRSVPVTAANGKGMYRTLPERGGRQEEEEEEDDDDDDDDDNDDDDDDGGDDRLSCLCQAALLEKKKKALLERIIGGEADAASS